MSVILRRDGKIRLYCKGADTVILARLAPGNDHIKAETQEHLDVSCKYIQTKQKNAHLACLIKMENNI